MQKNVTIASKRRGAVLYLSKQAPRAVRIACENFLSDLHKVCGCRVRLAEEARGANIVNISGDEPLSKYETARRIVRARGLDDAFIVPVSMSDSSIFQEKRAAETILDNSLIKKLLHLNDITMRFC